MRFSPKTTAFSLVEIVIALGVASVSLVTTIALLAASLESRGRSADDTLLASMTEHILSELRSAPFDTLWATTPGGLAPATKPTTAPEQTTLYFSEEGDPVEESDSHAFYECIIKKTPDEATRSPGNGPYNLLKVELSFSSPYLRQATSRRPNERSLYASIARY